MFVAPVLHGFPVRASETGTLKQKERSPTQASPVPWPLLSCRGHVPDGTEMSDPYAWLHYDFRLKGK
jgi:hypothetical protein